MLVSCLHSGFLAGRRAVLAKGLVRCLSIGEGARGAPYEESLKHQFLIPVPLCSRYKLNKVMMMINPPVIINAS